MWNLAISWCYCMRISLFHIHMYNILFNQQNSIQNKLNCVLFLCIPMVMMMTQYTTVNIVTLAHSDTASLFRTHDPNTDYPNQYNESARWFQFFVFLCIYVCTSVCKLFTISIAWFSLLLFFWSESLCFDLKSFCILFYMYIFFCFCFFFSRILFVCLSLFISRRWFALG